MTIEKEFSLTIARNLQTKAKILALFFGFVLILQVFGFLYMWYSGVGKQIYHLYTIGVPVVISFILFLEVLAYKKFGTIIDRAGQIPRPLSYLIAMAEVSFPSLVMIYLCSVVGSGTPAELNLFLSSPPLIAYLLFIILSSLHLDFWLSFVVGLTAGVEYSLLNLFYYEEATLFLASNLGKGMLFLASGLVAGIISKKIRESVMTALQSKNTLIHRLDEEVKQRTAEIEQQKEELSTKNKEIISSINYAQRIQSAILTAEEELQKAFGNDYFILFKPKEVVSGDFYWAHHNKHEIIWTAADCTGHGVPGAFMSMIGHQLLNETAIEKGITEPGKVLNRLRDSIIDTLQQRGHEGEMRDGMDMALCKFQIPNSKSKTRIIEFSGAKNPLYVVGKDIVHRPVAQKADKTQGDDLIEIAGDKQPIGYEQEDHRSFTTHYLELQPGDALYTFSDGYPDQFGGSKGKKFTYKRFRELLLDIQGKPMEEQKNILVQTIENWTAENDEEQIDDICVVGVRV